MGGTDPLILEMMQRLPSPDSHWRERDQFLFLRALGAILDFLYPDDLKNGGADWPLIEVRRPRRQSVPSEAAPPGTITASFDQFWLDCVEHIPGGHPSPLLEFAHTQAADAGTEEQGFGEAEGTHHG